MFTIDLVAIVCIFAHPLAFDAMYGAFEWMNIAEGPRAIIEKSTSRHLSIY